MLGPEGAAKNALGVSVRLASDGAAGVSVGPLVVSDGPLVVGDGPLLVGDGPLLVGAATTVSAIPAPQVEAAVLSPGSPP